MDWAQKKEWDNQVRMQVFGVEDFTPEYMGSMNEMFFNQIKRLNI